jgi:NAD(P)-dependent dehydrogenase (short-subunit alcohol dehydrogenase family)
VNPIYDFAGQVAVVTGGSSGMGLATARAFAEAGAAVVIADINEATLGTATDELTAAGHRAFGVRCDVSDEDSVAAMVMAVQPRRQLCRRSRPPRRRRLYRSMIEADNVSTQESASP